MDRLSCCPWFIWGLTMHSRHSLKRNRDRPLYAAINGGLEINTGANPLPGILEGLKSFGLTSLWLIPAGFGFFTIISDDTQNQGNHLKLAIMTGGAVASLIGIIIANKYWNITGCL